MRFLLTTITSCLLLLNLVSAQSSLPLGAKLGVSAGIGISQLSGYEESTVQTYYFEVFHQSGFAKNLSTYSSLNFSKKGGNQAVESHKFHYTYQQLAASYQLTYHPLNRFTLRAGLYAGWNVGKNLIYKIDAYNIGATRVVGAPDFTAEDELQNWEWGLAGGIDFLLPKKWAIGLNVQHALSTIYRPDNEYAVLEVANDSLIPLSTSEKVALDQRLRSARSLLVTFIIKKTLW